MNWSKNHLLVFVFNNNYILNFNFRFGNDKVKKEFLEPSVKGDVVSSIGVSEPGGGSDVARYIFIFLARVLAKALNLLFLIFMSPL